MVLFPIAVIAAFDDNRVQIPKKMNTFCASKKCKKHVPHKVSQYKAGKASLFAQGTSDSQDSISLAGTFMRCHDIASNLT
jgi:ribosomal protein L44E